MNVQSMKRLALRTGLVSMAVLGLTVATGTTAEAGDCSTRGCGGIVTNSSSGMFRVANNWCWSDRTVVWTDTLSCASTWSAYSKKSFFLLGYPDTTLNYSSYYDTDAFRVDARCKMLTNTGHIYDNSTSGTPMWVKISNLSNVTITRACF